MTKIVNIFANGIAYLYSGIVLATGVALGFMALASVVIVFVGIFGFWK